MFPQTPFPRKFLSLLLLILGLLGACIPALGDFPTAREALPAKPYPGVQLTALVFSEPRPLRVWVVQIDLTSPDLDFVVTPRGKFAAKHETASATTVEFAKEFGVQLAINASPFGPIRQKAGEGVAIQGLSVSQGDIYSQPVDKFGALVLDAKHQASILSPPIVPEQLKGVYNGVGGFAVVLKQGKNLYLQENAPDAKAPRHPRTAVGLSGDRKTMWWLVVDGRQKNRSEGVNLYELAELGRQAGCADLLNVDGGGSTTLVLQEPARPEWRVINTPVGRDNRPDTLRFNGNHLGLRVFTEGRALTAAQLHTIMPVMPRERILEFLGPLNRVMDKFAINTPRRRAAFLAQLAHESGEFRYMEEIASGEAYEGRKELGNTEPGDGKRYKGRGPIQLTGRYNYRKAGEALGLDLEGKPEQAARPDIGCQVAGWFWDTRKLNALADEKDFKTITRRINGGLHGLENREKYYRKALEVLKAE